MLVPSCSSWQLDVDNMSKVEELIKQLRNNVDVDLHREDEYIAVEGKGLITRCNPVRSDMKRGERG